MRMKMDKKYSRQAVTIVAALMLLCLYSVIFSFSEQDGEQSGSLSRMITEKCIDFFNNLSGKGWSAAVKEELAAYFENPIRKMAHFAEYACMAVLVYTMWRPWKERDRRLYLLVTVWVFVSAAADEIHQLFVPGRWGSFADVLLDTGGGIFGIVMCVCLERWWKHKKTKCKKRTSTLTE